MSSINDSVWSSFQESAWGEQDLARSRHRTLGDKLGDPSVAWPDSRETVEFGVLSVTKVLADDPAIDKKLLFIPSAVPAGIEPADPMITARSNAYPVSFGRRQ